ncbi:putative transporter [Ruminobacter sp.]
MSLFSFSEISIITIMIALSSVIGIALGAVKYKGVGLGIGGVLFGGIFMGWLAQKMGWIPEFSKDSFDVLAAGGVDVVKTAKSVNEVQCFKHILHYVQEFGLILFVYTIGIQVGPGFFASLKGSGVKLIGYAIAIVFIGASIALSFNVFFGLNLDSTVGIYAGAVTNTPALGAGQAMIGDLVNGLKEQGLSVPEGFDVKNVASAYAVAYPFGICGILLTMLLIRFFFRVNINAEGEKYELQKKSNRKDLNTQNVSVNNSDLFGLKISEISVLQNGKVGCSRLKRGNILMVPKPDTVVYAGDILHLIGEKDEDLNEACSFIGETVQVSLTTKGTDLSVRKVVVTNEKILGKSLDALEIKSKFDVAVSRLIRTGMEFIPHSGTVLHFGDQLNIVGRKESIDAVANVVGDSAVAMQKVHMMPVFVGLVLGMFLGCLAIPVPGLPAALKLGLAGGPLVVAILLSRYGHVITMGKMHWFMPASGNSALREIGIVLFLAIVGFNSGANGFVDTLIGGDGLKWMGYGVFVTFIPIFICGILAYKFSKINYLSVCGAMAGSMTDPPALAFANGMYKNSEASSLGYATVYPFTMFLRILTPQLMIVIAYALMSK